MKNIKKITKSVATGALLVGATLAGAATMSAAQSSSNTLGDYPQPFVDEDGNVQSTIVVGESAKTVDVVGAVNIAGSLGNAAFKTTTKSVEVSGSGGSWSASQGVTLDTQNDALYFGDNLDTVRDTLTNQQLSTLKDTTFRDDNGDETDVENYLYPANLQTTFGKPDDRNNKDPIHYVKNPSNPSDTSGDHLFQLQANFEDEIDFAADDVEDEEIQLFGQTYTVSTDTNSNELVLLGSQDTTSVDSGSSKTVTINGNEHTFEVVGVTDADTAAFRVDGELMEKDEEDTFTIDGTEVRVDDVIQTNADNSKGTVQFAVGSDELVLQDGAAIEDGDGNDIDGTYVTFSGLDSKDAGDGTDDTGETDDSEEWEASGINVYVGAENDDHEFIQAGNSYSHSLFPDYTFRYGGLAPNAQEGGDGVSEVSFSTSGDDTVTASFTSGGSSTSLEVLHDSDTTDGGSTGTDTSLADDDNDQYVVEEGESVYEDQYFAADAGDFAHLWEVTNIDRDTTGTDLNSGDEATITLQDAVTGDSVEVDLDASNPGSNGGDEDYTGTEVIDGQTYSFTLDGTADDTATNSREGYGLKFAYGTDAGTTVNNGAADTVSTGGQGSGVSGATSVYAPIDLASGSAMALTETVTVATGVDASGSSSNTVYQETLEMPSTESTDSKKVDVSISQTGTSGDYKLTVGTESLTVSSPGTADEFIEYKVGETVYTFEAVDGGAASSIDLQVTPSSDQDDEDNNNGDIADPGVLTVLPEDDQDNEEAYFVSSNLDTTDDEVTVNNAVYTGAMNNRQTATLESNDDVTAGVDFFGTYTEYDSDEQHTFTMNVPAGQSTVGAAFTVAGGSLSAEGGGSGSVQTSTPTGFPDAAALDTDSTISSAKQNSNMILVGGPAVNNLVAELADAGKTWSGSQYSQGQALIQLVQNAFSQGNDALVVAGYSGSDTREAANYIANYADHQQELAGKSKVTLTTTQSQTTN